MKLTAGESASEARCLKDLRKSGHEPEFVCDIEKNGQKVEDLEQPTALGGTFWNNLKNHFYSSKFVRIYKILYKNEPYYITLYKYNSDNNVIHRGELLTKNGRGIDGYFGYEGTNEIFELGVPINEIIQQDIDKVAKSKQIKNNRGSLKPIEFVPNPAEFRRTKKGVVGWASGTITMAEVEGVKVLTKKGKLTDEGLEDPNNINIGFLMRGMYQLSSDLRGNFSLFFIDDKFYPVNGLIISGAFNSPYLKTYHITMADKDFLIRLVEAYKIKEDLPKQKLAHEWSNNWVKFPEGKQ
jgi:hypothetical protein